MSMARIAFVNGRYLPIDAPAVQAEDRGLQFADSVYEVWTVRDGRFLDSAGHFRRLLRSLDELRIPHPMSIAALDVALKETLRRNRLRDAAVYLQVTRGTARRDHGFPAADTRPTVIITARPSSSAAGDARAERGVAVVTRPDTRWARCDIKTTGLLANVLAKQDAREAGAWEAWLVDAEGKVTEGTSTNAWIVTSDGVLVTRPTTDNILHGVTRAAVIEAARAEGHRVEERGFTLEEAQAAREAFITSATSLATPVVEIDGRPVGNGAPGSVATRLRELYLASAHER
jgi:D-alanine transaminase